jgi:hypothetical protein
MSPNLPAEPVTSKWQPVSHTLAEPVQRAFIWDRDSRVTALYEIARRALAKRGGADVLRAALDERESYLASISKAFHRDGRSVPIDWLPVIGEDEEAAYELASGINALLGFDPPVKSRTVDPERQKEAAMELIAEMDEEHREIYRKKLARKLGVRAEDVKL